MKRDYKTLVQIAEQINIRDTFALKSCINEITQIKGQIAHLRRLGAQASHQGSPQQSQTVVIAWLSWRDTKIAALNLKLFDASASLERHKQQTRKSFGKAMAYKRVLDHLKN